MLTVRAFAYAEKAHEFIFGGLLEWERYPVARVGYEVWSGVISVSEGPSRPMAHGFASYDPPDPRPGLSDESRAGGAVSECPWPASSDP